jgi:hypothetical protein
MKFSLASIFLGGDAERVAEMSEKNAWQYLRIELRRLHGLNSH